MKTIALFVLALIQAISGHNSSPEKIDIRFDFASKGNSDDQGDPYFKALFKTVASDFMYMDQSQGKYVRMQCLNTVDISEEFMHMR